MKTDSLKTSSGGASSKAFHRAVLGRAGNSPAQGHRYERRKIREYLRHPDEVLEDEADVLAAAPGAAG